MAYIIGIDGGGTKTTALFSWCESDLGYQSLNQRVVGEAINPQLIGFAEMKGRLKRLIQKGMDTFSIPPEQVIGMSVGLAGVRHEEDHQKVQEKLRDIVLELKLSENIIFSSFSDVYVALRGSLKPNDEAGILVISGTGSNAIGLTNNGEIYRSGGWGHILGDEGSGYQIGLRALNKICRAYDLRDQPTLLSAMIINQLE
ncbi:N-acetylglucosamine kinase [Tuberibacillus sp. Marseille-P3662]|uniref:N-acetylglucosamine kinase n=1 Tax=Tuberibacillus sp. Marseille-P3662 TaxID=1965358 RepID=UPI001593DA75|nr:BadF/BadG/BcrA/BcrD ATPase family protein [Tuberibacillus sp. Marseille-P3662]